MQQHRQSRVIMATEDNLGGGTDADAVDVLNGDGAEAPLLEMTADAQGATDQEAAIVENENAAISLENLVSVAEGSLDTDGLDETSAQLLQTAVQNELAPLAGAVPADEVIPAMENFRSASSRRDSTIMAIESISEQAKKLWARIREMIQKVRDFFKKMWINAKQAVQGLQRRVKGLQQEHAGRNFSMPKAGNVELKDGRWAISGGDIDKIAQAVDAVLKDYNSEAVKYANAVASALNAGKPLEADGTAGKGKNSVKVAKVESFMGDGSWAGGYALAANPDGSGYILRQGASDSKAYSAKPLKGDELKKIIDGLEKIATTVINYEKGFQEKDRAEEGVLKAGDAYSKKAKGEGGAGEEAGRSAFNSTRDAANALNHPTREVIKYATTLLSAVGGFVAANLKMYDKK